MRTALFSICPHAPRPLAKRKEGDATIRFLLLLLSPSISSSFFKESLYSSTDPFFSSRSHPGLDTSFLSLSLPECERTCSTFFRVFLRAREMCNFENARISRALIEARFFLPGFREVFPEMREVSWRSWGNNWETDNDASLFVFVLRWLEWSRENCTGDLVFVGMSCGKSTKCIWGCGESYEKCFIEWYTD